MSYHADEPIKRNVYVCPVCGGQVHRYAQMFQCGVCLRSWELTTRELAPSGGTHG
jgi:rubrerythrin